MVRAVVGGVRAGIRYRSSSGFGIPKLGPPEVKFVPVDYKVKLLNPEKLFEI